MFSVTTELTVIPKAVVVLAGDSIFFGCTGKSINWIYTDLYNKHEYKDIYINKRQLAFRKNDYSIRVNESLDEANLFIRTVQVDMAGLYSCHEAGSDFQAYELIVLGKCFLSVWNASKVLVTLLAVILFCM